MKTFFNVLYRRILYKIPLKFLLILLSVVAVFMACFSNASFECAPMYAGQYRSLSSVGIYWDFVDGSDTYCLVASEGTVGYDFSCQGNYTTLNQGDSYCVSKSEYPDDGHQICVNFSSYSDIVGVVYFPSDCLTQPYTSLQCQTEYNLIPISSVDQSYCVNNNLCPSGGSPSDCPNVGVSNVFINDIFHPGAFNVIINIPEEIDWDYAYTNSGSNINIDVVGYNVDYTKVQDQIDIQNFKPSKEDLSSIITQVVPLFIPGLAIILLLYFIFRFIKKVF